MLDPESNARKPKNIRNSKAMMTENKHIIISNIDLPRYNWEKQFEHTSNYENIPESNFSAHIQNAFDEEEWTW